jgi:hypothetical protein
VTVERLSPFFVPELTGCVQDGEKLHVNAIGDFVHTPFSSPQFSIIDIIFQIFLSRLATGPSSSANLTVFVDYPNILRMFCHNHGSFC